MSFMIVTTADAATKIQRVISPGGIEAWLVEEHTVPLISLEFSFRGGSAQDEAGKSGTATMLAGLLDEGAGDLDGQAYQERLEESAIELSFSAARDNFDGSLKALVDKRDEGFELLRLAVAEARLDSEPVERIRAQILARIRRDSTDPGDVAYETWANAAFPGHPYGLRAIGTEQSVEAITREDIVAFRDRNFARSNLVVAVVGSIDAATLGPALDKIFGTLPAEPRLRKIADVQPENIGKTEIVEMDIPQTTIVFGRGGLTREDPDYIPAVVMNHILGGGTFTSRLFNEVREKRGLAYSVHTYLDPMEHSGVVGGGIATKNERAAEAMQIIEAEFAGFAKDGPTADELAKAKKYLTGSYALNFDSSVKVARGLKQIQISRLPIDYIDTRNALVEAVTVDDVKRVARRILGDGDLLVVAVGKPAGFLEGRGAGRD
jgi:zinc protease